MQVIFKFDFNNIANSFISKLKKKVLVETHQKDWPGQHSELLYWTSNGQFKSKMDLLTLDKVSNYKVTRGSLTNDFSERLEDIKATYTKR